MVIRGGAFQQVLRLGRKTTSISKIRYTDKELVWDGSFSAYAGFRNLLIELEKRIVQDDWNAQMCFYVLCHRNPGFEDEFRDLQECLDTLAKDYATMTAMRRHQTKSRELRQRQGETAYAFALRVSRNFQLLPEEFRTARDTCETFAHGVDEDWAAKHGLLLHLEASAQGSPGAYDMEFWLTWCRRNHQKRANRYPKKGYRKQSRSRPGQSSSASDKAGSRQ